MTITKTEINDDEAGPSASTALPLTNTVSDHQEAGSSSIVAVVANLPAPPELATQTHLPAPVNMPEPANPPELANPPVPVIDVDQEMIAPVA